jgi:hypothetical protein
VTAQALAKPERVTSFAMDPIKSSSFVAPEELPLYLLFEQNFSPKRFLR